MQTKNNLTIQIMSDNSSEMIVIMADDGYNPVRIPLALEDAEKLNRELNYTIERQKNDNESKRTGY